MDIYILIYGVIALLICILTYTITVTVTEQLGHHHGCENSVLKPNNSYFSNLKGWCKKKNPKKPKKPKKPKNTTLKMPKLFPIKMPQSVPIEVPKKCTRNCPISYNMI